MPLTKNQLLSKLYQSGIFTLEQTVLKSGKKSPYYCDFRKLVSLPELYQEVINFSVDRIKKLELTYQHLACVPIGSLPFTTSISTSLNHSFVIPRSETKSYGKKCSVEGNLQVGDNVVVIEDVVTTGASVLEAVETLKNNGANVEHIVCLFDREEEGEPMIRNKGIQFHYLINLNDFIKFLESNQLTDNLHLEQLKFHHEKYKKNQLDLYDNVNTDLKTQERKDKLNRDYQSLVSNSFNNRLLTIVKNKHSSLCLSLDVNTWKVGKPILEKCGPHICMVKLHLDLIQDWDQNATKEILEMANTHQFLIMEDCKMDDTPVIIEKKIYEGRHGFGNWVDAITINSLNFKANNEIVYRSNRKKRNTSNELAVIPVGQYNVVGSLVDKHLSQELLKVLSEETDDRFKCNTIVQQTLFKTENHLLRMTPGVVEVEDDLKFLENNLKYRTIEDAMLRDRNHIVIIGSNILEDDNIEGKCKKCASKTWNYFDTYYKKILNLLD
jgi:uridine monophosphate synthetase